MSTESAAQLSLEFLNYCVFNPELGTQNDVSQQLVYLNGEKSKDEFVHLIGVTQGIMELNNAFSSEILNSIELENMDLVLVPLTQFKTNWRNRFWFVGEMVQKENVPKLLVVHLVKQRHKLNLFLGIPEFNNLGNFEDCFLDSALVGALKLANGLLNPVARNDLNNLLETIDGIDFVGVYTDDCGLVYNYKDFDLEFVELFLHSTNNDDDEILNSEQRTQSSSSLSSFKWLENITSFFTPATGHLNAARNSVFSRDLHCPKPKPGNCKITVIRRLGFQYVFVYQDLEFDYEELYNNVSKFITGFNFAYTPPVNFDYLVVADKTYVSSLSTKMFTDLAPSLLHLLRNREQKEIIRVRNFWICSLTNSGLQFLIVKPVLANGRGNRVMTELHTEVSQWVKIYKPPHFSHSA